MQLLNFSVVKLTFCLIIGIALGYYVTSSLHTLLCFSLFFLFLLFLAYNKAKNQFNKTIWFGVLAYLSMVCIGILTTHIHNQKNAFNHYSHQILVEKDSIKTITFRIREVLKPNAFYDKYIVDVLKVDSLNVSGKTLLNIETDSLYKPLKVDAIYITKTTFKDISAPLNPYQFNYKNYLEKTYIYHQLYITNNHLLKLSSKTHTLFGIANNIREFINKKLKQFNFTPDELAIINALLLGQRQDINSDVYTSYSNAGAIHILAVSGLHVGIILLLLLFILKPLKQIKHGKLVTTVLIVTFLWCFAFIAGLSASVTRAVTMFSILSIAISLKRPTNTYNTLVISMFIILLIKPLFLFDIGFQLSYLAVFSIVTVDPYLYKLYRFKNWFIDKLWHSSTVTISAQLGILPISLYYFHQFPGLFLISNLGIIPFLGLILGLGILVIILAILNILPYFIANTYASIIDFMNGFVSWIAKHEAFIFKDIPFGILHVATFYLVLISLVYFFIKSQFSTLKILLIAIILFQLGFIYTTYNSPSNTFIVFHKNRHTLLGHVLNNTILVAHDCDSLTNLNNSEIKDYMVGSHINSIEYSKLQSVYKLKNKILLVVDSMGVYNVASFKPDYVLLRQSPKINLNRLIDSIGPKQIIADGSNYKSYTEHWSLICKRRKLPFHQTHKKGAFIIAY